jgi:hypothetical protein
LYGACGFPSIQRLIHGSVMIRTASHRAHFLHYIYTFTRIWARGCGSTHGHNELRDFMEGWLIAQLEKSLEVT